jgi:hypothetical protein
MAVGCNGFSSAEVTVIFPSSKPEQVGWIINTVFCSLSGQFSKVSFVAGSGGRPTRRHLFAIVSWAMGDLIKSAKQFAISHSRRISASRSPALQDVPSHLRSVAQIVASVSHDEETIAAAWLHDVVGDTGITIGDVERKFGAEVARLVGELTAVDLTDRYNRISCVALAKKHFAAASGAAKTIKLADIIDTCNDLFKGDPAALKAYASAAQELVPTLEGGDASLIAKLKVDLKKYDQASLPEESNASAPRFRLLAVPIAALRVIERALTARHIAEPLISFDSECESRELQEAMRVAGVEVAGIYTKENLWGFVEASCLREGCCVTGRPFAPGQVISSRSSLTEVIEVLMRHDRCFVSALGNVVGVISRSDLHKPVVRMWLFGILAVAELEFTERIRKKWPNGAWVELLPHHRVAKAEELQAARERNKEACQLLDCLHLSDKIEILMSDPSELAALGIPSATAARRASEQIESLRNSLAHARDFVEKDWPQVVRLARRIQQMADEF